MAQRSKQPASESLQKWLLFASTMILGALTYQSQQMTGVLVEIRGITRDVEANARDVEANAREIKELKQWRYSQPFRKPDVMEIPKVALPLDQRRRLHIEGPYRGASTRF